MTEEEMKALVDRYMEEDAAVRKAADAALTPETHQSTGPQRDDL